MNNPTVTNHNSPKYPFCNKPAGSDVSTLATQHEQHSDSKPVFPSAQTPQPVHHRSTKEWVREPILFPIFRGGSTTNKAKYKMDLKTLTRKQFHVVSVEHICLSRGLSEANKLASRIQSPQRLALWFPAVNKGDVPFSETRACPTKTSPADRSQNIQARTPITASLILSSASDSSRCLLTQPAPWQPCSLHA